MVAGLVSCSVLKTLAVLEMIMLPVYLDPIIVAAAISLTTILTVSRLGSVREEEKEFRDQLHVAPPELADPRQARLTMIWPKMLVIWGVICAIGLVVFYARPYQLATGQASMDGPFVVWSGELALALTYGALFICGGLIAHWAIRRFYVRGI